MSLVMVDYGSKSALKDSYCSCLFQFILGISRMCHFTLKILYGVILQDELPTRNVICPTFIR